VHRHLEKDSGMLGWNIQELILETENSNLKKILKKVYQIPFFQTFSGMKSGADYCRICLENAWS
jgi:hypothetical protein